MQPPSPRRRCGGHDAHQAAEGAARLPARLHRSSTATRRRSRRSARHFAPRLARDRPQAPAEPRAEGPHPPRPEPEPRAGAGAESAAAPAVAGAAARPGRGRHPDRAGRDCRRSVVAARGAARPRRDLRAPRAGRLDGRRGHPRRRPGRRRVAPPVAERRHRRRAGARRGDRQEALPRARAHAPRARQRAGRAHHRAGEDVEVRGGGDRGRSAAIASGMPARRAVRALRARPVVPPRLPVLRLQRLRGADAARGGATSGAWRPSSRAHAATEPWKGRTSARVYLGRRHAVSLLAGGVATPARRRPPRPWPRRRAQR